MLWNQFVDKMGHIKADLDNRDEYEGGFGFPHFGQHIMDIFSRQPEVYVTMDAGDGSFTRHLVYEVEFDGRFVNIRTTKEFQ